LPNVDMRLKKGHFVMNVTQRNASVKSLFLMLFVSLIFYEYNKQSSRIFIVASCLILQVFNITFSQTRMPSCTFLLTIYAGCA